MTRTEALAVVKAVGKRSEQEDVPRRYFATRSRCANLGEFCSCRRHGKGCPGGRVVYRIGWRDQYLFCGGGTSYSGDTFEAAVEQMNAYHRGRNPGNKKEA